MPASISGFVRDALAEDKFGSEFNSKIDERVNEMNAAQLQGVYNHLFSTARTAKSSLWKQANTQIITHVEGLMRERVGIIERAAAKQQEEDMKLDAKEKLKIMRKQADIAAREAVDRNAFLQATQEIKEAERLRKLSERAELLQKNARLADERDLYVQRTGIFFVASNFLVIIGFSLSAVSAMVNGMSGAIIGGYFGLTTLVCGYCVYRKYKVAVVHPLEVTEEDLDERIEAREDEIRQNVLSEMAEQKRKFKEAERKNKLERRARKEEERLKAEYEAEMQAALLKEKADAAAEYDAQLAEAKMKITGGASTLASGSRGDSRISSPARPAAHEAGASDDHFDEQSVGLTIEGDFSSIADDSEAKEEKEDLLPVLLPTLGIDYDSDLAVRNRMSVELSLLRVDIRDLTFTEPGASRRPSSSRFDVFLSARLDTLPQSARMGHVARAAGGALGGTGAGASEGEQEGTGASGSALDEGKPRDDAGSVFWESPVVGTMATTKAITAVAPGKNDAIGGVSHAETYFQPLQFRGYSHHGTNPRTSPASLSDNQRLVVVVQLRDSSSADSTVSQDEGDYEDDLHRAEMGISTRSPGVAIASPFFEVGKFEFSKADVLESQSRQPAADTGGGVPSSGCPCEPFSITGKVLNRDFDAIADISIMLLTGPNCARTV